MHDGDVIGRAEGEQSDPLGAHLRTIALAASLISCRDWPDMNTACAWQHLIDEAVAVAEQEALETTQGFVWLLMTPNAKCGAGAMIECNGCNVT